MEWLWPVLIVVGVLALVGIYFWSTYNSLVQLNVRVDEAWSGITVQLKRRADLIPNLIETVKGYASHERAVFEEVTAARAAALTPGAGPATQAVQEDQLTAALGRLFAVAEAYPVLRASENFAALQTELATTEDRIAAGRRFYNANVRTMNTKVETFPANLVARMFGFVRAEYFEANDPAVRAVPRVDFGGTQG